MILAAGFVTSLFITVAAAIFCIAAIIDLRHRRIPNALVLAVIGLAGIHMMLKADAGAALGDIKWAGVVFVGVLVLWKFKVFGGGDAKLLFGSALLVGQSSLVDFLLMTILCGGLLGLLSVADLWLEQNYGWSAGLAFPRAVAKNPAAATTGRKPSVPYGIAISFGCLWALFISSTTMTR